MVLQLNLVSTIDSASGFWIGTGNPWEALGVIGGPAVVRHLLKVICLPLCFEASQVW